MSGAVSLGIGALASYAGASTLGAIGAGLIGGQLLGGQKQPGGVTINSAPTAPESQASKSPTAASVQGSMSGMGQSGGAPGAAQTLLTGPGGVDQSKLTLGKNTLLGT